MELRDLLRSFEEYGISYTINGDQQKSMELVEQLDGKVRDIYNQMGKETIEKIFKGSTKAEHAQIINGENTFYLGGYDNAICA